MSKKYSGSPKQRSCFYDEIWLNFVYQFLQSPHIARILDCIYAKPCGMVFNTRFVISPEYFFGKAVAVAGTKK
jgi:hypothetical protein